MMNWIAGQWPDRFKCLVSHDGIFDNRSMYYSTEELWFPEWEMGGPEYRNPAAYAKHNPVDYCEPVENTDVGHSRAALDYRVPDSQGLGGIHGFTSSQGIPSDLVLPEREPLGVETGRQRPVVRHGARPRMSRWIHQ